ncbi:hypothetical protein RRG08_063236 [Elysia crispata]|uniref:Uncharacterized protein n=1 Tax=Elysia crispata TaxID=231223 RepID=A0AAE0Y9F9_9GAST|nr:hypothetical protein RRG08_063236 [Elysia crispata]
MIQISATRPLVEKELDTPFLSDLRHPSTRGERARHTFSVRSPPPVHSWSKSQTHLLCQISATRPLVEKEPDTPSLSDLRHPSTRGARARHTFSVRSPPPVHSWSKSQTHLLCQISATRPLVEKELDTPSLSDLRHPSTRGARARHTFSVRSPPPVHSWSKSQTHLLCQISATRPLVEQEPDTPSLSDLRHPSTRGARARHTFSVRSPPPVHSWSKSQTHLLCQISATRPLVEQEPDTPSLSDLRHPSTRRARARHTFSVRSPPPVHSWSKSQTHLLCQISATRPLVAQEPDTPSLSDLRHPSTRDDYGRGFSVSKNDALTICGFDIEKNKRKTSKTHSFRYRLATALILIFVPIFSLAMIISSHGYTRPA